MIVVVCGALLVALLIGGAAVRLTLSRLAAFWRPTAGLTTMIMSILALVLAVREDWIGALIVAAIAAVLALGTRWRPQRSAAPAVPLPLSVQEARSILGVAPAASRAEIEIAYRRLIKIAHPDAGGTRGLAAQLNSARDRLLRSGG